MLTEAQTRGLLDIIVATSPVKAGNIAHLYLGQAGPELLDLLIEYFRRERRARVRVSLLECAGPLGASDSRVLDLAALGLSDRSLMVRRQAIWMLSATGNSAAIPLLVHWQPRDEDDARLRATAIRVIESGDLQEWVRGTIYSSIVPWTFTRDAPGSPEFDESVDVHIRQFASDLVPALERVLSMRT